MNLFTNRLTTPVAGATARPRRRGRALVVALGAATLTSGLFVRTARADPGTSLQAQAQTVAARVAALDAQMARQDEALDLALVRVQRIDAGLEAARRQVGAARAKVASSRKVLRQQAVLAYLDGGQSSGLQYLLEGNAASAAVRQSYLDSVANSEQAAVDSLQSALSQLSRSEAGLEHEQAAALAAADRIRRARDASAQAAAAEQAQLSQVKGQLAAMVAQVEAQQQAAEQQRFGAGAAGAGSVAPPVGSGAGVAVQWAQRELGKPYVYGGAGPDSFDCSGLTMYVWGQAGVSLPHSAAAQWDDTARVPIGQLRPGDLVFYYQPVDHVGIYVGGGQMIVAPHSGTVVQYQSIYQPGLDGGGRVQ